MNGSILIKGGRVVDPAQGIDAVSDVLIIDGKVLLGLKDAGQRARPRDAIPLMPPVSSYHPDLSTCTATFATPASPRKKR